MDDYRNLDPQIDYFVYSERDTNWRLDDCMRKHSFVFVLDGAAEYELEGKIYRVRKNDLIYIKPNTHRKAKTEYMNFVAIDFCLKGNQELNLPILFHIFDITKYIYYFQELNSEWLKKGLEYRLKCKGLFILILHMLFTEVDEKPKNRTVEDIKNYIIKNYLSAVSVNEIAAKMGISAVYCGALFKKYEKCTISHYINQIRIHQAINLMETSNMNISEIAYQTGFNDIYYFSKIFKKTVGIPPSDFKKKACVKVHETFKQRDL